MIRIFRKNRPEEILPLRIFLLGSFTRKAAPEARRRFGAFRLLPLSRHDPVCTALKGPWLKALAPSVSAQAPSPDSAYLG